MLPSEMQILLLCTKNLFSDTTAIILELISLLFGMINSSLGERVTGQQTVLKRVQDGRIS